MTQSILSSLMCDEALDSLQKTPEHKEKPEFVPSYQSPIAVKAIKDLSQVKDVRVLQNLLRNEERFMPSFDYMSNQPMITADMRKIVSEWMLDIVQQERSQPEVFCLAINILDRFLSTCAIYKTQLQLLGAVCLLIASKIREPCPILGKNLILYSDYSINAEEIKVILTPKMMKFGKLILSLFLELGTPCSRKNAMGTIRHHTYGLLRPCHPQIGSGQPCGPRRAEATY